MAALTTTVNHDLVADVTVVRVRGWLDLRTAALMRAALLKCVSECPSAIVVDVSDCLAGVPAALTVFPAVFCHQSAQPIVAGLLSGVSKEFVRDGGAAALGPISTYATLPQALDAAEAARTAQKRVHVRVRYTPDAPRLARDALHAACGTWGLRSVPTSALLIVTELVTNAVLHGHGAGAIDVEAMLRDDFLHLRVHDGSPDPPAPAAPLDSLDLREHGRGLHLVAGYSSAWGYVVNPSRSGKVVWATLRVPPVGTEP
jgi:anti-sigma regulatory factor (Ser/Thr protein kinase)